VSVSLAFSATVNRWRGIPKPDVAVEVLPVGCAAAFAEPMTIKAGVIGDKTNTFGGIVLNGCLVGSVELGDKGVDV